MDVITNNRAVAEFFGGIYCKRPDKFTKDYGYKFKDGHWWKHDCLIYHSDWNWFMGAYNAFRLLDIRGVETQTQHAELIVSILNGISNCDLVASFDTLCRAINWYNNLNKQ